MNISEKFKAINNKIKQNKGQCNLYNQIAEISALSSGNVSKYEFLVGKNILPKKDLLEKAATMKLFKYSLLGKELKAQIDILKKRYQKIEIGFKFDKRISKKNQYLKNI